MLRYNSLYHTINFTSFRLLNIVKNRGYKLSDCPASGAFAGAKAFTHNF
jgi:hypothetical protein